MARTIETFETHELDATSLRGGIYFVRPRGQLGTCGFWPESWQGVTVTARDSKQAIEKALRKAKRG
jgi:hypothetical protein